VAPRIQRLRQRQEQLNAARLELENLLFDRKVELADMETLKSHVENLRNLLEDSSLAERKSFIKSFVREVRVTGTEVLLSYNIPLSAVAAPRPETRPEVRPSAKVRRMHNMPIGPTGAAIKKPMANPLSKKLISTQFP